ncbi:cyclin-dependent kinase inhibitor 3 isoform X2 [Salmo trutta]|uniref:cyclin-dependent kinase inhibitor 3 isoform X2 n=1 Tax=Salmo trutta TaxID=8032 RepID=UPI0011306803|nr:cyclin-dependent kinase inhibitor 3 isoform X2 [Salmo trutta]
MRTSEFDSSSDEEEVCEEHLTPFQISWLPLSIVDCSLFLGICPLPGCKFKDIRRNLLRDVGELQNQGVQDVFVFCTRGELHKYRVPSLLETYRQQGLVVHHLPFPDGGTPELQQCCQILEGLQANLHNNRKTVIHCCLSAASAVRLHDSQQSHRDPERAQRGWGHSDSQAIQLPA